MNDTMDQRDHDGDDGNDLVLLVAVHALAGDELARAEAEIESDPVRRAELDSLREVLGRLAAAEALEPPVEMRARVLDLIADEPQEPAAPSADDDANDDTPLPRPIPLASWRRRRTLDLAAAAAVVALVVGGVAWLALGRGADDSDEIAAVLDDPNAQTLTLDGEASDFDLVFAPDSDRAVLVGEGLPDPGAERTYQLWFLDGPEATPSDTFRPEDGQVEVLVDDFNSGARGFAVSIEPAGGSETPTSVVAMVG